MRAYGNWCGPGWTAGQYKDASKLTEADRNVPAIDALDEACKQHDLDLHDFPEDAKAINEEFIKTVSNMGITGKLFGLAVKLAGPGPTKIPKTIDDNYDYHTTEDAINMASGFNEFVTPQSQIVKRQKISPSDKIKNKFPWKSLSNLTRNNNMSKRPIKDTDGDVEMASTSRSMQPSNTAVMNNQETKISFHKPTYMLPETYTAKLPSHFYFSGILTGNIITATQALDFIIRPLNPRNPLNTTLQSPPANTAGGLGGAFVEGLYNAKIPQSALLVTNGTDNPSGGNSFLKGNSPSLTRWTAEKYAFPATLLATQQPIPKMWTCYSKMYEYYTVIQCDYEIIIEPVNTTFYTNSDMMVCMVYDTYATDKTNNQTLLSAELYNVLHWKDIKKYFVKQPSGIDNESRYTVISGSYKPGQGRRSVENDEDVKTWHKTTSDPTLTEEIHFMFFNAPFNTLSGLAVNGWNDANPPTAAAQRARTCFNAQVKLSYLVQFKDLKKELSQFDNDSLSTFSIDYPDMFETKFTAI